MARSYSTTYQRTVNATAAAEVPRLLLEISHPALGEPLRFVNDTDALVHQGQTYIAAPFRYVLPDDFEGQLPRAQLQIDNVGRELTDWLEATEGGAGAGVRMLQVLRSDPDVVEWEVQLELQGVLMDVFTVSGQLGFEDVLNRPACALSYRPETAPGLY
jgi:hypothetical protein